MQIRRFLVLLLLISGLRTVSAQDTTPARAGAGEASSTRAAAKAASAPSGEEPKKRSLLERFFGGKKPSATPASKVGATPAPARYPRPRPRKPAEDEEETAKSPSAAKKPATEKEEETPSAAKTDEPAATPAPGKRGAKVAKSASPAQTKEQIALDKATATGNAEAVEKAKYDEVKSRANADTHVQELHEKANNAESDEEGRKALRAYNKALFQKMRSLDESLQPRVDRMEAAVLKQLETKE